MSGSDELVFGHSVKLFAGRQRGFLNWLFRSHIIEA